MPTRKDARAVVKKAYASVARKAKVLFLCTGDACCSRMAEVAIPRRLLRAILERIRSLKVLEAVPR